MPRPSVTTVVCAIFALSVVSPTGAVALDTPAPGDRDDDSANDEEISITRWNGAGDWSSGTSEGSWAIPGGLVIGSPSHPTEYTDPNSGERTTWKSSTWTSPVTELDFDATEIIASWNASTPHGTWVGVEMRTMYTDGETSPWYTMGNWASDDTTIERTTVEGQSDGRTTVLTDTVAIDDPASDVAIDGYQIRLNLHRTPGSLATPRVSAVSAMASDVPVRDSVEPSDGGIAWGTELDVPRRSQNIHSGNYPEYGGGGEVWCSPTSTTMVMEYFGVGPTRDDMDWIEPGYTDPQVAHAARMTWDHAYEGAGNWPFNTAYAASFGLDSFVTRLHSLDDLERLIAAGIPVVTSQSFRADELDGAGYGTAGHLFVVVGFTEDGDVIVNDPASDSNDTVRRVYSREQFEQVWLRTQRQLPDGSAAGGSGGIAYIMRPHDVELPDGGAGSW